MASERKENQDSDRRIQAVAPTDAVVVILCDLSMPLADEDSSDAAVGMDGSSMVDIDENDERLRTKRKKRTMGATGLAYRPQTRRFHLHKGCRGQSQWRAGIEVCWHGYSQFWRFGEAVSARNVVTCIQPIRIERLVFR